MAVRSGHVIVVEELLRNHADIEGANLSEWMPLHAAAILNYIYLTKRLLDKGANIESKDMNR